jgi:c-di-GMP-binding flagellar brake protein YcgR
MTERFDQREFVRVPDCSEVVYTSVSSDQKKKSETKDISQSGICFIVEEKLEVGAVVDISLSLEHLDYCFVAKGIIRWINEIVKNRRYEAGVKFINLPETDVKKLLNYLTSAKRFDNYR